MLDKFDKEKGYKLFKVQLKEKNADFLDTKHKEKL